MENAYRECGLVMEMTIAGMDRMKIRIIARIIHAARMNSVVPMAVAFLNLGCAIMKMIVKTDLMSKSACIHLVPLQNSHVPTTDVYQCLR